MSEPHIAPAAASDEAVAATRARVDAATPTDRRHDLELHRAQTERLRVLVEFLSRPVHAHGGADPDPDIVVAYNLAVEAALQGIRRAALGA